MSGSIKNIVKAVDYSCRKASQDCITIDYPGTDETTQKHLGCFKVKFALDQATKTDFPEFRSIYNIHTVLDMGLEYDLGKNDHTGQQLSWYKRKEFPLNL